MSARGYTILVGIALAVAGLIVLNLPNTSRDQMIYASGLSETVVCGTALSPREQTDPGRAAACDDMVGTKQGIGFGLGGAGLLVLAGGLLVRSTPRPRQPAPGASDATPAGQP